MLKENYSGLKILLTGDVCKILIFPLENKICIFVLPFYILQI